MKHISQNKRNNLIKQLQQLIQTIQSDPGSLTQLNDKPTEDKVSFELHTVDGDYERTLVTIQYIA